MHAVFTIENTAHLPAVNHVLLVKIMKNCTVSSHINMKCIHICTKVCTHQYGGVYCTHCLPYLTGFINVHCLHRWIDDCSTSNTWTQVISRLFTQQLCTNVHYNVINICIILTRKHLENSDVSKIASQQPRNIKIRLITNVSTFQWWNGEVALFHILQLSKDEIPGFTWRS